MMVRKIPEVAETEVRRGLTSARVIGLELVG
jgi:hypothetical protein